MKTIIHFFCFSLILTLVSCSQPTRNVIIDNSSSFDITVKFDQTEIIYIMARSKVTVLLKFGKQQLYVNDDPPVDIYLDKDYDYVINPTFRNYYIENVVYTFSPKGGENYLKDYGQITSKVGQREVNGDYRLITPSLAMAKTWSYGLDDPISGVVQTTSDARRGYKFVKRLVRESDVEAMAMAEFYDQLSSDLKQAH